MKVADFGSVQERPHQAIKIEETKCFPLTEHDVSRAVLQADSDRETFRNVGAVL